MKGISGLDSIKYVVGLKCVILRYIRQTDFTFHKKSEKSFCVTGLSGKIGSWYYLAILP